MKKLFLALLGILVLSIPNTYIIYRGLEGFRSEVIDWTYYFVAAEFFLSTTLVFLAALFYLLPCLVSLFYFTLVLFWKVGFSLRLIKKTPRSWRYTKEFVREEYFSSII